MTSTPLRADSVPTLRVVVAIAVTGLGLGFFGRVWWLFDLLANYRPLIGVTLLGMGVFAWVLDRGVALGALFAGFVGLSSLLPLYAGAPQPPAPGVETIEIVSFNVSVSNPNRAEVARYLVEENPDLVFLFESNFEWEADLRRAEVPLIFLNVVPRGQIAGVTVLASTELAPVAIKAEFWREAAAVSLVLDGRTIEVLGLHPPSPRTSSQSALRDQILRDAGEWVAARDAPVVLVGDLNASPWSAAYRRLRWRTGLIDSMFGAGLQTSWPDGGGLLSIPIDHVLHSIDLGSANRRTGPFLGSAHRPVLVSVGFARTP